MRVWTGSGRGIFSQLPFGKSPGNYRLIKCCRVALTAAERRRQFIWIV